MRSSSCLDRLCHLAHGRGSFLPSPVFREWVAAERAAEQAQAALADAVRQQRPPTAAELENVAKLRCQAFDLFVAMVTDMSHPGTAASDG